MDDKWILSILRGNLFFDTIRDLPSRRTTTSDERFLAAIGGIPLSLICHKVANKSPIPQRPSISFSFYATFTLTFSFQHVW